MPAGPLRPIVPGIAVSPSGEATVDPALTEVLLDLATALEEPTALPVDIEHVLAAIVLAAGAGELPADAPLRPADPHLRQTLTRHVTTIFRDYGGRVGRDE